MTMRRLLALLLIFTLALTNGAAVATAMCQHQDSNGHALALTSSDDRVSGQAHSEETAAMTASKKGALSEAAAAWLAGYALPAEPPEFPLIVAEPVSRRVANDAKLASRSLSPLLDPPLA